MSRLRTAVPALVLGALVAQAGLASPASAAGVRYAAPTGTGTACSSTAPCSLETAVNGASAGDEVVVGPGTYTTATSLTRSVANLDVHGAAGQPRPVVNSSASRAVTINQSGGGTRIADLSIVHSGGEYGLNVFAKGTRIERVSVRSTGLVACSPGISGLVRDSLCVTTAPGGIALDDSWGDDSGTLNLRNVTAVATGPGSLGIRADASGTNTGLVVDARNVIASGAAADVRASGSGERVASVVTLRSSNFDAVQRQGIALVTSPGTSNGNQTAAPLFLDTATYRQAPGSPTIDQGVVSAENGPVDLDGDPRVTGAAPDIGADELDVTAPDTVLTKAPKRKWRKRKAKFRFAASEPGVTFTCKVDKSQARPCTSPLKVRTKRYGKHTVTITARDAVGNVDASPAVHVWKLKHRKAEHREGEHPQG